MEGWHIPVTRKPLLFGGTKDGVDVLGTRYLTYR